MGPALAPREGVSLGSARTSSLLFHSPAGLPRLGYLLLFQVNAMWTLFRCQAQRGGPMLAGCPGRGLGGRPCHWLPHFCSQTVAGSLGAHPGHEGSGGGV